MTDPIVSTLAFKWFLTLITGGLATAWLVYDSINLVRARKLDRADPVVRDRHFGYAMGILIGLVGIVGTLRFNDVL